MLRSILLASLIVSSAAAGTVCAEVLLVDRTRQEATMQLPSRGMTMGQVEARFGAPTERLDPRGGQKRQWPTINRWSYPAFIVYFEKNRVVDAVANRASANETGPKPAIR